MGRGGALDGQQDGTEGTPSHPWSAVSGQMKQVRYGTRAGSAGQKLAKQAPPMCVTLSVFIHVGTFFRGFLPKMMPLEFSFEIC